MNLKHMIFSKNEELRFYYLEESASYNIAKALYQRIPIQNRPIVVVCIGTDRSTGDSLGPLVGSLLQEYKPNHFSIYGTLESPIHAKNLEETMHNIVEKYNNPFILAIDACLGKTTSVGSIIVGSGPIKPGAAVQKKLPEVGDLHITGVVNISGYMEYFVLQNTRLALVMKMAKEIAQALRYLDFLGIRIIVWKTPNK
jgi:putative sporulation protein YyaC